MLKATGGANTHKGAIFSLGVLVTATAFAQHQGTDNAKVIAMVVQNMLRGLVAQDFEKVLNKPQGELTAGERQYMVYGETGIRGEAEAGYPTVVETALPYLAQSTGTRNQRLLDTLMVIVASANDSNLIKRAGTREVLTWTRTQVAEYFAAGGAKTQEGMAYLDGMNQKFLARNLSLGGSADLLILTIYFGLLENIL